MKTLPLLLRILRGLVCSGLLAGSLAHAAPVPVNNASFETAVYSGTNSWTNNLTDWTGQAGNDNGNAFIERIGGFVSAGLAHIGMATGYYVFQDTTATWKANTRYTLTVGIGNRAGQTNAANSTLIGLTNVIPSGANTADQLSLDSQLALSGTSANVTALTTAGKFTDLVMTYETGGTPPEGSVVVFLGDNSTAGRSHFDNIRLDATSVLDPDGDGLPSDWESANGLNPNIGTGNDGATGDPDNDGSTNAEEFARGTNPQDNDSDDDGALDGWETLTGTYVDATHLGTDPLNPDSDGDTLLDGAETTTAIVTDPNNPDTDGDQFEDQAEIAAGTNPSVGGASSVPSATGDLFLGINFVGGRVDGTPGGSVTGTAGVVPQANWNNISDPVGKGAPLKEKNGTTVIQRLDWTVDDTFTVGFDTPADDDSAIFQGYLKTRDAVLTQVKVHNIQYPAYDVYIYADSADTTIVSSYTVNGATLTGISDADNWPVGAGGGAYVRAFGNNSTGNYLLFQGVTGPTLTITAANVTSNGGFGAPINAVQIVRSTGDSDGDGMPDVWEDLNGLNKNANDAAGDADSDGSNNLREYTELTDPQNPDTDGDGVSDGPETGTGVWISLTDRGTNPKDTDSDDDGLSDGVENNSGVFVDINSTGSNPNLFDTDGDGHSDADEAAAGTDPSNAGSLPSLPAAIAYWPFDDQDLSTTADVIGTSPGTISGTAAYVAGHTGAAGDYSIDFNGTDTAVQTFAALLDSLDGYTMSGWVNFTENQADRTGYFGVNDTVEFGMSNATTLALWDPTGGQIEAPFGPSSGGWKHVAVVSDTVGRRVYLNGVLVVSGAVGVPTSALGGSFNIGGGGIWDATGNFFKGQIDDVAVWNAPLSSSFIRQLALGEITPLGPPGSGELAITDITFTPGTRDVTLKFSSVPNRMYSIEYRNNALSTGWLELTDITATGAETSITDFSVPANIPSRFYRVREIP